MVLKNCSIVDEHVIIVTTQWVTIAIVRPAKNTLTALGAYNSKMAL